MNWFGFILSVVTLFLIGSGFVWVIYGERFLGSLWWPYFMGLGFLLIICSVAVESTWISAFVGALGASFIWGSTELKSQETRVRLGWYPSHPGKIRPPLEEIIKKWKAPSL